MVFLDLYISKFSGGGGRACLTHPLACRLVPPPTNFISPATWNLSDSPALYCMKLELYGKVFLTFQTGRNPSMTTEAIAIGQNFQVPLLFSVFWNINIWGIKAQFWSRASAVPNITAIRFDYVTAEARLWLGARSCQSRTKFRIFWSHVTILPAATQSCQNISMYFMSFS